MLCYNGARLNCVPGGGMGLPTELPSSYEIREGPRSLQIARSPRTRMHSERTHTHTHTHTHVFLRLALHVSWGGERDKKIKSFCHSHSRSPSDMCYTQCSVIVMVENVLHCHMQSLPFLHLHLLFAA